MDMKKRIIRVFPTKTNATPTDELVRIRETPSFFDEADEVHVSVTFTWDIPIAEWLAKQWEPVATVKIGGPAYNEPGGDFIPGMYMRHGYVITSRGCPNRCWFCAVPKRESGKCPANVQEYVEQNMAELHLRAERDGRCRNALKSMYL